MCPRRPLLLRRTKALWGVSSEKHARTGRQRHYLRCVVVGHPRPRLCRSAALFPGRTRKSVSRGATWEQWPSSARHDDEAAGVPINGTRYEKAGGTGRPASLVWCAGSSVSWYRTGLVRRGGLCVLYTHHGEGVRASSRIVAGSSLSAPSWERRIVSWRVSLESSSDSFLRMAGRPGPVSR